MKDVEKMESGPIGRAEEKSLFHPALWTLNALLWKGSLRRYKDNLKTARGMFQLLFMLFIFCYLLFSLVATRFISHQQFSTAGPLAVLMHDYLAAGLLLMTSYSILFSSGEATVHFTPSEVAFLFPAPITRRQLFSYKLLNSLMGMSGLALIFSLMISAPLALIPARYLAILLTLCFLSLVTMNVAFLRAVLREKLHRSIRWGLSAVIVFLLLSATAQSSDSIRALDLRGAMIAFQATTAGGYLLAPFQVFAKAVWAPDWPTFLKFGAMILAVDCGLLLLAYRLDALSLESALAYSEKVAARMKAIRSRGVWNAIGTQTSAVSGRRIPQFPFWNGLGPIIWQRLTTTYRASSRVFWLLAVVVVCTGSVVYLIGTSKTDPTVAPMAGVIAMAYLTFLISMSIQNDIERVSFLKSLPIGTTSIVLGDLIGFPILLALIQSLFIVVEACFFSTAAYWLLCALMLTLPYNMLVFGIDKLVFYVYPTRLAKGAPGDFQAAGKQMMFVMLKMIMFMVAVMAVAVVAVPVGLISQSPLLAVAAAWFMMMAECVILVPLLNLAFRRFDAGFVVGT